MGHSKGLCLEMLRRDCLLFLVTTPRCRPRKKLLGSSRREKQPSNFHSGDERSMVLVLVAPGVVCTGFSECTRLGKPDELGASTEFLYTRHAECRGGPDPSAQSRKSPRQGKCCGGLRFMPGPASLSVHKVASCSRKVILFLTLASAAPARRRKTGLSFLKRRRRAGRSLEAHRRCPSVSHEAPLSD